jgi:hypothetical protein
MYTIENYTTINCNNVKSNNIKIKWWVKVYVTKWDVQYDIL